MGQSRWITLRPRDCELARAFDGVKIFSGDLFYPKESRDEGERRNSSQLYGGVTGEGLHEAIAVEDARQRDLAMPQQRWPV